MVQLVELCLSKMSAQGIIAQKKLLTTLHASFEKAFLQS